MEDNTKVLCKSQLENLANSIAEKDGKDLSLLIIQTCSSLMGLVGMCTPVSSLNLDEVSELVHAYSVMRYVMSSFINDTAERVNAEELKKEIENMLEKYKKNEAEYTEAKIQSCKLADDIEKKKTQIQGIYATNNILLKNYENAVDKLEKLEKLAGEFSEESLETAEQECVKLTEETTALRERQNVINAQTAECLGQVSEILAHLEGKVTVENTNVAKICKEADNLKKSITALTNVYNEYKAWFNVLKTPAQQLEEDIGKPEMEKLRACLDESKLARKHDVVKQTEENLKYLEKLVASCSVASQADNRNVVGRAGK